MTNRPFTAWVLGSAFVIGGAVALLMAAGVFSVPPTLLIAAGTAAISVPYFIRWMMDKSQWWALITAYIFLATAFPLLLFYAALPYPQATLMLTLIEIAIPFAVVFFLERSRTWALLPAYAAFALTVLVGLSVLPIPREMLGAGALLMTAVPLGGIYLQDRSKLWALIAGVVIAAVSVLLLVLFGFVAISDTPLFTPVLATALAGITAIGWVLLGRRGVFLWLAGAFLATAVTAAVLSATAGWGVFALIIGVFIIVQLIRGPRASQPATQQPPTAPQQKAKVKPMQQQTSSPQQPPSKSPVTGFRSLTPPEEDDEP